MQGDSRQKGGQKKKHISIENNKEREGERGREEGREGEGETGRGRQRRKKLRAGDRERERVRIADRVRETETGRYTERDYEGLVALPPSPSTKPH